MNDRVAIFQAMALQEVANDLHASLNSMSDPKTYKLGFPICPPRMAPLYT